MADLQTLTLSLDASGVSAAVPFDRLGGFAQLAWTGTPTGTLTAEVSITGAQWDALDGVSFACSGAPGSGSLLIAGYAHWSQLRFRYVRASGSGNLGAAVNQKDS